VARSETSTLNELAEFGAARVRQRKGGELGFFSPSPVCTRLITSHSTQSLLIGAVLEATCSLIAGLVGHYTLAPPGTPKAQLTKTNKRGGDTIIAFAVMHAFSFAMFWGPTPWVYLGESFPLRVRPKAIALGSATNWIWNLLLSFFSVRISNHICPLILLIFFGMLVFGFFYVWFFIPETKGLALEEVDELYRARIPPWKSVGWKPAHITSVPGDLRGKTVTRVVTSTEMPLEKGGEEMKENV
jgi:MFS transporter, SP family, sugar:H+ symporter